MICPSCRTEQPGWGRYCASCGVEQSPRGIVCVSCGTGNPPGSRFCSACGLKIALVLCLKCGAWNQSGQEVCSQCRTPIEAPDDRRQPPTHGASSSSGGVPWSLEAQILLRVQPDGLSDFLRSDPVEATRFQSVFDSVIKGIAEKHHGLLHPLEDAGLLIRLPLDLDKPIESNILAVRLAREIQRELVPVADALRCGDIAPVNIRIAVYQGDRLMAEGVDVAALMSEREGEGYELLRLCPPGEICVSEVVQQAVRSVFQEHPVGLIGPFGKRVGGAFVVGDERRRPAEAQTEMGDPIPLAGRERELSHLRRRWKDVSKGSGSRLITIVSAPGMGRAKLVEALSSSILAEGGDAAVTICTEANAFAPFQPFVDLIYQLIGVSPEDDGPTISLRLMLAAQRALASEGASIAVDHPDVVELVTIMSMFLGIEPPGRSAFQDPGALEPDALRQRMFYIVLRLLRGLSQDTPRALFIENIHRADAATIDLFEYLGSTLRGTGRLLFVCTATDDLFEVRPSWGRGWWRHERLSLAPLAPDAMEAFVQHVLGEKASPQRCAAILQHSEGSPALAELIASGWLQLIEAGAASSVAGTGDGDGSGEVPGRADAMADASIEEALVEDMSAQALEGGDFVHVPVEGAAGTGMPRKEPADPLLDEEAFPGREGNVASARGEDESVSASGREEENAGAAVAEAPDVVQDEAVAGERAEERPAVQSSPVAGGGEGANESSPVAGGSEGADAGEAVHSIPDTDWDEDDALEVFEEGDRDLTVIATLQEIMEASREGRRTRSVDGETQIHQERTLGDMSGELPGMIWSLRLSRLPPEVRRVAAVAAVAGPVFHHEVLVGMLEEESLSITLESALGTLRELGFIARRSERNPWLVTWRFRSELLYRVIYDEIGLADRAVLHRRLARLLEADRTGARMRANYALVAFHCDQGEDADRALRYYVLAGKRARRCLALSEGERLFTRALHLLKESGFADGGSESVILYMLRGKVLNQLGESDRAVEDLDTALDFARLRQDRRRECEILMSLCDVFDARNERGRLLDYAFRARDAARAANNTRLLVKSLTRIGWERLRGGQADEGQATLEEAVREAVESGDPVVAADAMDSLGAFYYLRGNYGLAVRGYEDLLSLLKRAMRRPQA